MTLPQFHLFIASTTGDDSCLVKGYPGIVLKASLEYSSIASVALACRQVFDHTDPLSGGRFGGASDQLLGDVASYWANDDNQRRADALSALLFLRLVFRMHSKTDKDLINSPTPLGKRIGLLKQYAHRIAAHMTLEDYSFSLVDVSHVMAVMTLLGAIVASFDAIDKSHDYFDQIDAAATEAATT